MRDKTAGLLRLMVRDFPFTLALGAIILAVSIPYNLMLPSSQYCGSMPSWAAAWMHLTAPFNIGCEASLTNLWTTDGALSFIGNYPFLLILTSMAESTLNRVSRLLKRNIFVAAIIAAYILEITSLIFFKTMNIGTSIIGVSMMITLICWQLYRAWQLRADIVKAWMLFSGAIILSIIAYGMYSSANPVGHALGAVYFIIFMVMYLKQPNWWEEFLSSMKSIGGMFFSFLASR